MGVWLVGGVWVRGRGCREPSGPSVFTAPGRVPANELAGLRGKFMLQRTCFLSHKRVYSVRECVRAPSPPRPHRCRLPPVFATGGRSGSGKCTSSRTIACARWLPGLSAGVRTCWPRQRRRWRTVCAQLLPSSCGVAPVVTVHMRWLFANRGQEPFARRVCGGGHFPGCSHGRQYFVLSPHVSLSFLLGSALFAFPRPVSPCPKEAKIASHVFF